MAVTKTLTLKGFYDTGPRQYMYEQNQSIFVLHLKK
jgi:hypothetical protein